MTQMDADDEEEGVEGSRNGGRPDGPQEPRAVFVSIEYLYTPDTCFLFPSCAITACRCQCGSCNEVCAWEWEMRWLWWGALVVVGEHFIQDGDGEEPIGLAGRVAIIATIIGLLCLIGWSVHHVVTKLVG